MHIQYIDSRYILYCTCTLAGHGDWSPIARPKLVEALLSVDIVRVACGPRHVLALSADDDGGGDSGVGGGLAAVYAWGCGLHGRTGLGDEEARYVERSALL